MTHREEHRIVEVKDQKETECGSQRQDMKESILIVPLRGAGQILYRMVSNALGVKA